MTKQLERIEIHPAKNGGHTVRHEFQRQPNKKGGSMSSGVYMERPEPEEHVFGPGDGAAMMAHVAKNLGVKGGAAKEPDGDE